MGKTIPSESTRTSFPRARMHLHMGTDALSQPLTLPRQRWLVLGLLLLFVLLSIQYYFKVDDEKRSAILRWRPQLQQLYEVNIYERFTYPNPPIMALLLKPLIELPP